MLRDSTQPATFALSVNIGNGEIEHWRLRREPQGYLIDAKAEHTMLYTTISEVIKTFNTTFKHRFRNGEIQNDCNTDQLIAQMKNSHISCDKPRGYVKVVPKQSNNDHTTVILFRS